MTERFELLSQLGKGGMGVVWKARDTETGEIVALKLLHNIYADEPDYVARFEREVEVARRIHSPHVVEVRGFGVREGVPYMAMEYVEGPSLRELLKARGPFTWEDARPILADVSEGLRAAHAAGVIHRDVKPSNILIAPDGRAKLADFGIARAMDMTRLTGSLTTLGTPAYMAPDDVVDERSDYYSLGCVAYEMLTGAPPFEGESMREVWLKHERTAPNLERVPKEARAAVAGLLEKDKERRARGDNISPVGAVGGSPPRRNPRWRVPVALGGGSIVLGSLLMLAVWTPFCTAPPPVNPCSDGSVSVRAEACATAVPRSTATDPTATPTATSTVKPTVTPILLTSTPVPPTATPRPPTATPVPPTSTPVPPTPTSVPTPYESWRLWGNGVDFRGATSVTDSQISVRFDVAYLGDRGPSALLCVAALPSRIEQISVPCISILEGDNRVSVDLRLLPGASTQTTNSIHACLSVSAIDIIPCGDWPFQKSWK